MFQPLDGFAQGGLTAVVSVYLLIVVMMAGTLPTPLHSFYARRLGLSPLWITMVFAMYVLAIEPQCDVQS